MCIRDRLKVLDTLLYFDAFCKEHHLRYYLAGGTLIGALRGGGFIPWDEDIDCLLYTSTAGAQ